MAPPLPKRAASRRSQWGNLFFLILAPAALLMAAAPEALRLSYDPAALLDGSCLQQWLGDHRLHRDLIAGWADLHHDDHVLHGERPDQRDGLHVHRHGDQLRRHRDRKSVV